MSEKTVVVTGGAGFIGSHIVRELVKRDYDVRVIDNLFTGKLAYLSDVKDRIRFVKGDITDKALLEKEFQGVSFVLHEAALRSVPKSIEIPHDYNRVNIDGTLNVLEAARENDARVIFASSSSVYGDCNVFPEKEDFIPAPKSPYALSKVAGEHYCRMFHELYGLETISLRYFNVFGSMQDPKSEYAVVIPIFITSVLNGKSPTIFGDGFQSRDFTYVANNVEANISAMNANKKVCGKTFNIASGEGINLNDLLGKINSYLGSNVKPVYAPPRAGDVRKTLASTELAEKVLGWKARHPFDKGLIETIEWYKGRSG